MVSENINKNEEDDHEDMMQLSSPFSACFASKIDRNKMIIYREVKEKMVKIYVLEMGK